MKSISRTSLGFALSLLCISCFAGTAFAQARAQFAVDVVATCQRPAMKDLPIHVEGTGILKTDGSARLVYRGVTSYRPTVEQTALARARYVTSLGPGSQVWLTTKATDLEVYPPAGRRVEVR